MLEDRVIAVPLGEVLSAHEGSVLGGAPVIMPEIEVDKINRVRERRTAYHLLGAQALVSLLGRLHFFIGARDGLLRLVVEAIDDRTCVALHTGFFHVRLGQCVPRALRRNLGGKQIGESLAWVVRYLLAVEPAHVTGGAGGDEHVARREFLRRDVQFELASLGREHDAVLRFAIDFELRMVGAHVALAAGRRQAGHLHRGGVARVAGGAGADRAVGVGLADGVAANAAGPDRGRALQRHQRVGRPPH